MFSLSSNWRAAGFKAWMKGQTSSERLKRWVWETMGDFMQFDYDKQNFRLMASIEVTGWVGNCYIREDALGCNTYNISISWRKL